MRIVVAALVFCCVGLSDANAQAKIVLDLAKKAVGAGSKSTTTATTKIPKQITPQSKAQTTTPAGASTAASTTNQTEPSALDPLKKEYQKKSIESHYERGKCYYKDQKTSGVGPFTKCTDEKKEKKR
jgi:hypothetical protein